MNNIFVALRNNAYEDFCAFVKTQFSARDFELNTPLHHAQTVEQVYLLVKYGADVNSRNLFGRTPLHTARERKVVNALIKAGADVKAICNNGNTALVSSVYANANATDLFIRAGTNVNQEDAQGQTALHQLHDMKACRLLIEAGANVNAVDRKQQTPIFLSCDKYHCKLLLNAGAKVNVADKNGHTPLHFAKSRDIAELLLDAGANIDACNHFGITPVLSNNKDVVACLIERGANLKIRDNRGLFAADRSNFRHMIIMAGGDTQEPRYLFLHFITILNA